MSDKPRPRWPVPLEWSRQLDERLSSERGLQARIARQLGIDSSTITDLRHGNATDSEYVMDVSDLVGIPRPFTDISRPQVRGILEDCEGLSDEDLAALRAMARQLGKK